MFSSWKNRTPSVRSGLRKTKPPATNDLALKEVLAVKERHRLPTLAQWRHLPRFLSLGERRLVSGAFLVALIAALALGYQYVRLHQDTVPAIGGSYTEGLAGYPALINPLYASASDVDSDLGGLIYSGLMRFDPQEGVVSDLAESYEISPDGKIYTFVMREGALFHDGEPVTAEDVAFTIHATQNPGYKSTLQSTFSGVEVEAVDARTVRFVLEEPFAPFLSSLTVGILPSHVWSEIPPGNAQLTPLNLKPIGSGPYQFQKLTKDNKRLRSLTLTRNKNFYRATPYIETLTFKFFASTDELVDLLRNRNIEGAVTVPYSDVSRFSNDRSLSLVKPVLPQYTAAFFNLKTSGVTADINVRKALNVGTDRATLVQAVLPGAANPLTTALFSGMPGGTAPENVPGADIAAATALLETAGFKLPEGGVTRMKGDKPLALTITVSPSPELITAAEELKRQWEALGFSVTVNSINAQSLQEEVLNNHNFEVVLSGELYGTFRDPYPYWHSSQSVFPGLNITQFTSRAADEAIITIRTSVDEDKRNEAYVKFADSLSEQVPAVFLYQPTYTYITSSSIKGLSIPSINLPAQRFADINEWYLKTKAVFKKSD